MSQLTPAVKPAARGLSPRLTWMVAIVLAVVIIFSFFSHRMNGHEKLVGSIVESIQRNDMTPVAKDFNAIQREQLTRASVGRLSDQLAPLGKLKNIRETTPKEASPRHYTFDVQFEKATWIARMALDEDGKITAFYLRPQQ